MPLHGPSLGSDRCQMESCNWIPFGFANGRSAENSNYPKHWQWCQSKRSAADRRTLKRRCHPQVCARRLGSAGGPKDPGFDIEGVPDVSSGGGIYKMLLIEESRDEYQANRNMPLRIVLLVNRSFVARDTIGVPDI